MAHDGISRRRMLQGLGATAAFAAAASRMGPAWSIQAERRMAQALGPGSRPDPSKPIGADLLPQVEHIVIYMQENRSYDHYFGMSGIGDGLTIGPGGTPTNTNPDAQGNPIGLTRASQFCDTARCTSQSWNATHLSYDDGAMDGFIRAAGGAVGSMTYWLPEDLPFYDSLARTFPICDRWFCSVMAQTFPNRRFLQAATSMGIVSTDPNEVLATPDAPNGIIWDRLNDAGITWKDYVVDLPDILLFPNFYLANQAKVFPIDTFLTDCANGTLPQVSIVSPGNAAYSEERPNDIQLGEAYSSTVIEAVLQSPQWSSTALFFTYDEHGGYYDHVAPPPAPVPDAIAPRITVPPDQPGAFDRYGMRVPGFVVSPFARADYVSHVVHDHTSILKFIETKWNLEAMTFRDANADDLLDCFDFDAVPFADPPVLAAAGLPASGSTCSAIAPPPKPIPTTTTTTTTTSTTTTTTSSTTSSTSTTTSMPAPSTSTPSSSSTPSGPSTSTTAPAPSSTSTPSATTSSPTVPAPTTSVGSAGTSPLSSSTLAALAAALPAVTDPGPRWGTDTGDGIPSGSLPKTGSSLDKLATAGGLAALGGVAVVLAARERDQRRHDPGGDSGGAVG